MQFNRLERVISAFNDQFGGSDNTLLVGGAKEPLYSPAGSGQPHNIIYFTLDYVSSALHEISHWCIAGEARRERVDYGYWYAPDGRSAEQQVAFEKVEVKPQAVEWLLSNACGVKFRVSADNLDTGIGASDEFKRAIVSQALAYCRGGLPPNALRALNAFAKEFQVSNPLQQQLYCLDHV